MLSDIYTKLKQVMPFDKIKCFHSELYNKRYTNAYKCSKNNITFFRKEVCDCIERGEITKVPFLLGFRSLLPNERKISHMK